MDDAYKDNRFNDAIEAKMLYEELLAPQQEVIETMGEVGESRSKETVYHVRRVALYSYTLAKLAGLSGSEAHSLYATSPMHDIGKELSRMKSS
ncbi:hypothetical protein [Salibacterium halotolerans]|uniref:HD-GYP domain-containing protein n=1 Tax=Salibacterium halotolerans TaxID=1884432 RepID=A0A1I5KW55_9BACI|nr:hypothetical protein [Salibacterium halotolerans]SFO89329.1 hypothetical protein SAMN05518683_10111 [Salibacterium halotolerans]